MSIDFGKILDDWENEYGGTALMEKPESIEENQTHRIGARRLPVEDSIDLHGMTVEQAEIAVDGFLFSARERGLRKVLIIHGKGTHSDSDGTLRREIRSFLEKHSIAGEMGIPKSSEGGTGAIWVMIRQRSL